jgi:hypothetical protein
MQGEAVRLFLMYMKQREKNTFLTSDLYFMTLNFSVTRGNIFYILSHNVKANVMLGFSELENK